MATQGGAEMNVSMTLIVRDEERTLARCLDSVAGAVDELVVVDTGSQDVTVEVARRYTDQVHAFNWVKDFDENGVMCRRCTRCFRLGPAILPGQELHVTKVERTDVRMLRSRRRFLKFPSREQAS